MATKDPYDEAKIVSLITEIYKIHDALCYYPEDAPVAYAPPAGHQIDEATCERLKISPVVISLMRKIPYPNSEGIAYSYPFLDDNSQAAVYTETDELIRGRDPDNRDPGRPTNMEFLKPTELALTFARGRDGVNVLLDTKDNSIRWWKPMESPGSQWPEGSPEREPGFFKTAEGEWDNPRSYYPRPAVEVLQEIIEKYRTLKWIPRGYDWACIMESWYDEHAEAKRRLIFEYGWPDNFDHEAFKREKERFWWEVDPENRVQPPEPDPTEEEESPTTLLNVIPRVLVYLLWD